MQYRKPNRLKEYDYSQYGYYFVTICTKNRKHFFGEILSDQINLSEIGNLVEQCWYSIPKHFPFIQLDEFVIMPNHIHGIVIIDSAPASLVGTRHALSLPVNRRRQKLPIIIGSLQSAVSKYTNHPLFAWQRSYYDHIIRNETSLNKIREYIRFNPEQWSIDIENEQFFHSVSDEKRSEYYQELFV